ncbi:hypothetical protein EV360DRAFT_90818 [Lentinula raphanica]|nr:hypothetical protein EV360DRAFT_90818 [Lentinula raphanica]
MSDVTTTPNYIDFFVQAAQRPHNVTIDSQVESTSIENLLLDAPPKLKFRGASEARNDQPLDQNVQDRAIRRVKRLPNIVSRSSSSSESSAELSNPSDSIQPPTSAQPPSAQVDSMDSARVLIEPRGKPPQRTIYLWGNSMSKSPKSAVRNGGRTSQYSSQKAPTRAIAGKDQKLLTGSTGGDNDRSLSLYRQLGAVVPASQASESSAPNSVNYREIVYTGLSLEEARKHIPPIDELDQYGVPTISYSKWGGTAGSEVAQQADRVVSAFVKPLLPLYGYGPDVKLLFVEHFAGTAEDLKKGAGITLNIPRLQSSKAAFTGKVGGSEEKPRGELRGNTWEYESKGGFMVWSSQDDPDSVQVTYQQWNLAPSSD